MQQHIRRWLGLALWLVPELGLCGWVGVAAGGVFLAAAPFLKGLAHGVNEPDAPLFDDERQAMSPQAN